MSQTYGRSVPRSLRADLHSRDAGHPAGRYRRSAVYQRPGCPLREVEQDPGALPAAALLNVGGAGTGIGGSMGTAAGRDRFWEMFKGRAVVIPELPAGRSRILAAAASEMAGNDGAPLRTKAEYLALYSLLLAAAPPAPAGKLRLLDEAGCHVLDVIRSLGRLGKHVHFHLHEGHPSSRVSGIISVS